MKSEPVVFSRPMARSSLIFVSIGIQPKSAIGPTRKPRSRTKPTRAALSAELIPSRPMSPKTAIAGNRFLAALIPDDLARLAPFLSLSVLELGAVINAPGSEVEHVYFPDGAILSVVTLMEDGRGVESCTIGRESAYGLVNAIGARSTFNQVIAQVSGPAVRINASSFKEAVVGSPTLRELVARHSQVQQAMSEQSAACNAVHQVEARLCRWLLLSQDRASSSLLPLTQEFLSYMLGVQRTTVTAAARSLHAAGLIRYSRGRLEVLDRRGLQEGACECYDAVRRRTDELLGIEVAA